MATIQGSHGNKWLVVTLRNVMNVKTSTKGKHKRDYTMEPVRSSLDWKLDFLREVADFLLRWEQSKKPGLSRETFLALRQTCLSLADCASYLLDKLDLKYILLGKLQSDDIESRLGWLRQLAGANYFISIRQVLGGDEKIRAISLLQFCGLSLTDIDNATQSDAATGPAFEDDDIADLMAEKLVFNVIPTDNDLSIVYYASGAVARSVVRSTKCGHCKEELVSDDSYMEHDSTLHKASEYLDSVNRGGLSKPTEYTLALSVICWRVFEELKASPTLSKQLLGSKCQRSLFLKIVDRLPDNQQYDCQQLMLDNYCVKGHDIKKLIVHRMFNCFAKNLVVTDYRSMPTEYPSTSKMKKNC
jgi:hypothetical protein